MLFHSPLLVLFLTQLCLPALAAKPAIYRLPGTESKAGDAGARRNLQDIEERFLSDPYWNYFYPTEFANYDDYENYWDDLLHHILYRDRYLSPPSPSQHVSPPSSPSSSHTPYWPTGDEEGFSPRRQLHGESTSEEASSPSRQNPEEMQKEVLRPQRLMIPIPNQLYYSPPHPMYLHRAPITGYPTLRRPFPPPIQYLHRAPITGRPFPGNFRIPQDSEVHSSVENEHESVDQLEEEQMDLSLEEDSGESQE